jgi:hypothetical protein
MQKMILFYGKVRIYEARDKKDQNIGVEKWKDYYRRKSLSFLLYNSISRQITHQIRYFCSQTSSQMGLLKLENELEIKRLDTTIQHENQQFG